MYLNACNTNIRGTNALTQYVVNNSSLYTIKIFDVKGKRAKTINTNSLTHLQELGAKMIDLVAGVYILNAFSKGNFIKSFRFIKD